MKKIFLISIAALFAGSVLAQNTDTYRDNRDRNRNEAYGTNDNRDTYRDNRRTRNDGYGTNGMYDNTGTNRNANTYGTSNNYGRSDVYNTVDAYNPGNANATGNARTNYRSAIGPRVNFYTNTDDATVGIGAYYRFSFDSHWRIEPSIYVLTEKDSSVDINFDAQYVFHVGRWWNVYPLVGFVANDIKDWAFGMSVGVGFDFNVARRWDISAGLKYEPMFDSDRSNPLVVFVGGSYRF